MTAKVGDHSVLEAVKFLKEFITAPSRVGAVAASSRAVADVVADVARVAGSSVVVEFGPGDGAITRVIAEKLPRNGTFFAIEISEDFCRSLRQSMPQVQVFHDSAENTRKYLDEMNLNQCDAVISGLPWAAFDEELQGRLLDTVVDVLRPGGRFVTYMYFLSPYLPRGVRFHRQLEARFTTVKKTSLIWRNLPPAFAYYAEK